MGLKSVERSSLGLFHGALNAPLRRAVQGTLSKYKKSPVTFQVVFSDGKAYQNRVGEPDISIEFKTIGAELWTILFTDMGFLDSYFCQTIDIHGDIAALTKLDSQAAEGIVEKNAKGPHSNPSIY